MADDRKTGYKFKQRTKEGAIHPGEDLNSGKTAYADLGVEVRPMAAGEVVFAKNAGPGWGNIVVLYHPELSRLFGHEVYSRYAHFSKLFVKVGQIVSMDYVMALCGRSGTGSPHCHWEVLKKKLDRWTRYTHGWTPTKIDEYFLSPYQFVKSANELASKVPEYAEDAVKKAISKMIAVKWDDPQEIIGDATVEQIFVNFGVLNKKEGSITKARFLVALDRLGILD